MMEKILTIENKKDEAFLRRKAADFDFKAVSKKEIADLIILMRRMMREAHGIGLSANQAGRSFRMFVAEIDDEKNKGKKFYAVFNPEIREMSKEKRAIEEGCLSVPGLYGDVERPERILLIGQDKNGKPFKMKAWGLLARVFQHEVDHLNGTLFTDKAKNLQKVSPEEKKVGRK